MSMSLSEKRKHEIEEEEKYRHAVVKAIKHGGKKSSQKHGAPLLLSIFIPGLGQLVKGEVKKGLLIFFAPIIAFLVILILGFVGGSNNGSNILNLVGLSWFGYIILYIWQLIDAYN